MNPMKENNLITQLQRYTPWNSQETEDRQLLLYHLAHSPDIFTRQNRIAHFTSSGWVVSPDRKQVLMAYHNLYQSWAWLGGHADGETDLARTAVREVMEESGLTDCRLLSPEPFSLEVLTVDGHEKKGVYVSSHLHLNVTWLIEADPAAPIRCKPDENSSVAWIQTEDIAQKSSEPWFCERIYRKLCAKVQALYPDTVSRTERSGI